MRSYCTVMYQGFCEYQYWLGELDDDGNIKDFSNLRIDNRELARLTNNAMLYYVVVEETDNLLQVMGVQSYLASPKNENGDYSVQKMIDHGMIDILSASNAIMERHRQLRRRAN